MTSNLLVNCLSRLAKILVEDDKNGEESFLVDCTRTTAIALVGLKLTGVVTWAWVWVLAPIWISALLAIVIMIFTEYLSKRR